MSIMCTSLSCLRFSTALCPAWVRGQADDECSSVGPLHRLPLSASVHASTVMDDSSATNTLGNNLSQFSVCVCQGFHPASRK